MVQLKLFSYILSELTLLLLFVFLTYRFLYTLKQRLQDSASAPSSDKRARNCDDVVICNNGPLHGGAAALRHAGELGVGNLLHLGFRRATLSVPNGLHM